MGAPMSACRYTIRRAVQAALVSAKDCDGHAGKSGPAAKLKRKAQRERYLTALSCAALAYSHPGRKLTGGVTQARSAQRLIDALTGLEQNAETPEFRADEHIKECLQERAV